MNKIAFILLVLISQNVFAIKEVPDESLADIAVTTMENEEAVITYNPEYCNTLGEEVCLFFRSHEYGHISLEHQLEGIFTDEEAYAADCWAAQNVPSNIIEAAIEHFENEGEMGGWSHGPGYQRAENLKKCKNESVFKEQADTEAKGRSALGDRVFFNLESRYYLVFPFSRNNFARLYRLSDGSLAYIKTYYNGAGLAEYRGHLFYKIPGLRWRDAGPIRAWV